MAQEIEIIRFRDLSNLPQANCVVWCGCTAVDDDKQNMQTYLIKSGLIERGTTLTNIYKIGDNVKGDDGRSDILLKFSKPISNEKVCGLIPDMVTLANFLQLYSQDYGSRP